MMNSNFETVVALIALSVFVGALAIEWNTVTQLPQARTEEQIRDWLKIHDSLRFLAAPSGSLLMLLGVWTAVRLGNSGQPIAWLCIALLGFLGVIILSSTWTPKRIIASGQALLANINTDKVSLQKIDRTLAVLGTTRVGILCGIAALIGFMPSLSLSIILIIATTVVGFAVGYFI